MTDSPRDPWRWRCPNGHLSWRYRGGRYECKRCGENFDREDLVDMTEVDNPEAEFAEGDSF